jgi:DNA polymerase-3 subunit epsilon
MLQESVAFLDLETTGANPVHDRITEVGLIVVENGELVEEWETLVNPGRRIPGHISLLTGITDEMVALAPAFEDIARVLWDKLDGRTLVAHNARFDAGFLKAEFQRLERRYAPKVLCTVKLSRALYPEHRRHNLDSLLERHAIRCGARHRALGDARVLWELAQVWRAERGEAALAAAVQAQLKQPALPPGLSPLILDELPETPGVYLFYGDNDTPLYVGKSVNLRSRVLSHFSADQRISKDMRIVQQIQRLDWKETAGELGALLEEARLVKALLPIHNRRLRRNNDLCAWIWDPATGGAPQLERAHDIDFAQGGDIFGVFRSKRAATDTLRALTAEYELCPIRVGLEKGKGPCFAHQLKRCRGVCAGRESAQQHDLRLAEALAGLRVASWPYRGPIGVRETGGGRTEVHVLHHWCHLGTAKSEDELADILRDAGAPRFDLDTFKILQRFLAEPASRRAVVELAA